MSRSPHPLPPFSTSSSPTFFLPAPGDAAPFQPHPALALAGRTTLITTSVGVFVSAAQNALEKHNKGAMGIFTRTGGTIGYFAIVGFTYSITRHVTANVREADDAINGMAGGCAAGFLAGLRARSLPMAVGTCAFLGGVIGTLEATGSTIGGPLSGPFTQEDREARRQAFFKKNPRRITDIQKPAEATGP